MNSYFSDRERGTKPRTVETINQQTWAGILSLLEARIIDGSLGLGFPAECSDGGAIFGTDKEKLWDRMLAEIPILASVQEELPRGYGQRWRPRREEVPPTDAILDLCELVGRNIGQPLILHHHAYCRHDHLRHDRQAGVGQWLREVNVLLMRAGLVYEMGEDGAIRRVLPGPLHDAIAQTDFVTGDAEVDTLLSRAAALLTSRVEHAHQDALEKLWDAFERVKTLEQGNKRESSEALLFASQAPGAPQFNEALRTEFRVLTDLGNKHRIRHSETDKEPIPSRREAEYLFMRMYALLRYVLSQTGRTRQP